MKNLIEIASQFDFPSSVSEIRPYGSGFINDTYVVSFSRPTDTGHTRFGRRAILQRINREVFPDPELIMENLALILQHTANNVEKFEGNFVLPPVYKTQQGAASLKDEQGNYWRALGFIEQTSTFDVVQNPEQARQAGIALGAFHRLLSDMPVDQLHDTLPGFHDTPGYIQQFDQLERATVAANEQFQTDSHFTEAQQIGTYRDYCYLKVEKHRQLANLLAGQEPAIALRVTHGDPKLNNFLFDQNSGQAVSLIDLDTVKPGLIHYDLGDCIRSCCNLLGEMPTGGQQVKFATDIFQFILEGYLSQAGELLELCDQQLLYEVVKLLPFELGLRFFTDYLRGNHYFRVDSPNDNLYRAIVQFQLLESIENQRAELERIIKACLKRKLVK